MSKMKLTCLALGAFSGMMVFADALTPAAKGDVKVLGRPGELLQASLNCRVFSAHAQGAVYDEATNSFATHWDDTNGRNGWQNEYWGKTMLCYAGAIAYTRDAALKAWAVEKTRAFVAAYQKPNGYLSTYGQEDKIGQRKPQDDPRRTWNFSIWGRKYTMWALIDLYHATGDRACLEAAEKMADHLLAQLKRVDTPIELTGSWAGLSPMTILKPMLLLYKDLNKPEYLEFCRHIVATNDKDEKDRLDMNLIRDALSDRPIEAWYGERRYCLAKAYELMSFFEGVAEYHRVTGDARALAAVKAFQRHLVDEEMNPMRSASYFDHFLGARKRVNGMTELCDVTHWIRLNRELWLLTGETQYLDLIEEAFYNAFLAGVTPDGAWGAHIIRSHGMRHLTAPAQTGMKLHQCCPDNMLRTFYDWADTVADVAKDGAWEVNLYSDADVTLPGAKLAIRGNYPVSETFRLAVEAGKAGRLRLRVPYWATEISVDGKALKPTAGRVELAVAAGAHSFALALAMPPRIVDNEAPDFEDVDKVLDCDPFKPEGYTKRFMSWYTPEMEGLARRTPATQVMRGPLVLAKGRAAGTCRTETLDFNTIRRQAGWKLSLAPAKRSAKNAGVWGAWELTMEKELGDKQGVAKKTVPVADYWSVSCMDDAANWFSLWF